MGAQAPLPFRAAETPRTLWIELTSKCPFDCVFCSRKARRGTGVHLPFAVYEALIRQLVDTRTLVLNYSGESTVYPDLIPAIRLARSTGAFVELVSAMASVPESMVAPLSRSGLNRLTVSVHAADPRQYAEIYRYSSFETLSARLRQFVELSQSAPHPPIVDLSFVAMDRNLAQLPAVAEFADSLGLHEILIFPVMRRDEIPVQFPEELTPRGIHRPDFEQRVRSAVRQARDTHSDIRFTICNPSFTVDSPSLGEVPGPYPGLLPPEGRVHSCEQNPWETAHVLSNGNVVACEVLDKVPLGNLLQQSMSEIWQGEAYRQFRHRYYRGEVSECRSCAWKKAYKPGPLLPEILGSRGRSAQLIHGWHDPAAEPHVWSSQQAAALIAPRPGSRALHVCGVLPPGPTGDANELTVRCNGSLIGRIANPWEESMTFGLDLPVESPVPAPAWSIDFRTRHVYRPSERSAGNDQRDLGFALILLASQRFTDPRVIARRQRSLAPLTRSIASIDRFGRGLQRWFRRPRVNGVSPLHVPGVSIVIPERDNPAELSACLESLREATRGLAEPVEVLVVVNGSPARSYDAMKIRHPAVRWQFHQRPLGFAGAVSAGLRQARFDWVYLLNNDVALDHNALRKLLPLRDPATFAIASQVFLKDATRFREETNFTALFVEDGLATIHDWIPQSDAPAPSFYAGGGASLFQTRLLREFLEPFAYAPFYWEDVEWGWRARKLGYRCVICPASVAHHRQQSTIGRCYSAGEVESVRQRNQLLFQLRNFTTAGSLERVIAEIAQSPQEVAGAFLRMQTLWRIYRGRIWNHLAPLTDEEVLSGWNSSIPTS